MRTGIFAFLCLALVMAAAMPALADAVMCPPILKNVIKLDDEDDVKNWVLGGQKPFAPLKGMRVFFGKPGAENVRFDKEIRPLPQVEHVKAMTEKGEEVTRKVFYQIWDFSKHAGKEYFLVCDYSGTENFLMRALDARIRRCTDIAFLDGSDTGPPRVECQ